MKNCDIESIGDGRTQIGTFGAVRTILEISDNWSLTHGKKNEDFSLVS